MFLSSEFVFGKNANSMTNYECMVCEQFYNKDELDAFKLMCNNILIYE